MKRILVPIDFSDYSKNALEVATYIAKVKDMQIHIFHALEDSYTPYYNMTGRDLVEESSLYNYRRDLQETVKYQLAEIANTIRSKNVEADFKVDDGRAHGLIIDEAKKEGYDLIVMGSHGYSDIEDIFIGSTAEKVIRLSPVPVLTVHKVRKDFKIDRIVFASDFEEPEVEPILQRVIDFAEIFMAELFLVRINTPSGIFAHEKSRKRLDDLAKKFKLSAGAVSSYSDRSEEEGIVNYAKEINADLITLCTHGRTGFSRLFKGSIAEEVAGYSEIPVLTYNIAKDKLKRTAEPVARDKKIRLDRSEKTESEDREI